MLTLDLRIGDSVDIDGGRVVIRVEAKSGQTARLSFNADKAIPIVKLPAHTQFARLGLRKIE